MANPELLVGMAKRVAPKLGGEPPDWVLVFPDGVYHTTKGDFLVDDTARKSIIAAWRDYGNFLAWDFEHEGLYRAIEKRLGIENKIAAEPTNAINQR